MKLSFSYSLFTATIKFGVKKNYVLVTDSLLPYFCSETISNAISLALDTSALSVSPKYTQK